MNEATISRAISTSRATAARLFRELSDDEDPIPAVRELAAAVEQLAAAVTLLARA